MINNIIEGYKHDQEQVMNVIRSIREGNNQDQTQKKQQQ
jgi:hypothetical protein